MSKFVKLIIEQSNPIGGGYHPNEMYINIDSISYIMQWVMHIVYVSSASRK